MKPVLGSHAYENKEPIAYDVFRARIALNREKTN